MNAAGKDTSEDPSRPIAGLLAGPLAGVLLWGLEVRGFDLEIEGAYAAVLRAALWLGASGILAGLVVALSRKILGNARGFFARRRLVVAVLGGLASLPLGFALGGGAGLARAGLGWAPPLVLPVATAGGLLVAFALARRLRAPRFIALCAMGAAFALRFANARLFVGLYAPVHDALFVLEAIAWGLGIRGLIGPKWRWGPSSANPLAFVSGMTLLVFILTLFISSAGPREDARAVMGRSGFHTPRFLRWRGSRGADDTPRDDALVRGLERWQTLMRDESRLAADQDWNLVWISVDTLRADRCGFIPGSVRRDGRSLTPNLDALAARSAVFERAYSPYPSTHLSAEAAFTGRYPRGTALYRRLTAQDLPSDAPARRLPALMGEAGLAPVATIAFTKEWMSHPAFAEKLADFERVNFKRPGGPDLDARHFVASARETLTALGDRRFFLWFHVFEPHAPYEPQPDFPFGPRAVDLYDAEVAYADRQVGELLKVLEARGLTERTVIVFSSDHGESLGEKGIRYHGSALSEVQLRVPVMVSVPGVPPTRRPELVSLVDLYPTALRLAGAEPPPNQGRDLSPLIAGNAARAMDYPDFVYAELPDDVKELSAASSNVAMLRRGRFKLLRHLTEGYGEVFDIAKDPAEESPVSGAEGTVKRRLEGELAGFADYTRDFGRAADAAAQRSARREALIARLDGEAAERLGALHELVRADDEAWRLATERVRNLVRDKAETPANRRAALHLLAVRGDASAPEACRVLARDDDGVLRWAAHREAWRLPELPELPVRDGEIGVVVRERELIAAARREGGNEAERLARVRRVARDASADPGVRHRARLALALAGDPQLDVDTVLAETWSLPEARRLLGSLREQGHPAAPVLVERLARDRYLYPELRDAILASVPTMDREMALRIGRHLLAGWDPSFHARATKVYTERFGAELCRTLGRLHVLEAECAALTKKQAWDDLVPAYLRLLEACPEGDFDDLTLDCVRAELAAGAYGAAATRTRARRERRGDRDGDDLRRRRAWAELAAANLERGAMRPDDKVIVRGVSPEAGARRRVLPGRTFSVRVRVANESERALPGGTWPRTGRFRVLWFADGSEEAIYGTEVPMVRGILPGEAEDRDISIQAPEAPGNYRGRIIVSQHLGARFFRHEDPALCEFRLRVLGPADLRTPLSLSGSELALNLPVPQGVELWGTDADGTLEAVCVAAGAGLAVGPLRWTAADGIRVLGRARSGGADVDLGVKLYANGTTRQESLPRDGDGYARTLPIDAEQAVLEIGLARGIGILTIRELSFGP